MAPTPASSAEPEIRCPQCGHGFKLTETLAAPLVAAEKQAVETRLRAEFEQRLAADRRPLQEELAAARQAAREAERKEAALLKKERELKEESDRQALVLEQRLREEGAKIAAQERAKAEAEQLRHREALERELQLQKEKLAKSQETELAAMKLKSQLEEERRTLELSKLREIEAAKAELRALARKEADDAARMSIAEKDKVIADLRAAVDEAKRKGEQGSQQLQGEVLELELEALLRSRFPTDVLEPVGKGEFGGDVVQRVYDPPGVPCGTILWESKRTKAWSDGWLPKLRDDQRAAKAEAAILVTQTLPKGVEVFGEIDRVWVTAPKTALAVATCVREVLTSVAAVRRSEEGVETKTEAVYAYLTGPRFKQRIEAMVEAFRTLQEQLDSERRAFEKQWAAREKQLERFMKATVGMYGDVQGIAGASVPRIAALEVDGDLPGIGAGGES